MKVLKAIFDKRFWEKGTIMVLYATKIAFLERTVFGNNVQNPKKRPFGKFSKGKEADPHFARKAVQTA